MRQETHTVKQDTVLLYDAGEGCQFVQPYLFDKKRLLGKELSSQIMLLEDLILSKKKLARFLTGKGKSYSDFRYESDDRPSFHHEAYSLSDFTEPKSDIPVVSFFSGAGGLDLGLEAAGFCHALLVEKNPVFCETLKLNRPRWKIEAADVSETEAMVEIVSQQTGNSSEFEGVFVGGPPCQPFSIASNQRFRKGGDKFKRVGFEHATNGNLLFDYIGLIKHFRPRVFLIENVPGLEDVDGGEQLQRAYHELEAFGYQVHAPLTLRAEYHFVPQQRTRLFIVGNRVDKPFKSPQPMTYPLSVGPVFERSLEGVENHVTREHSAESVRRYMRLDYGQRDKLGRVDRLDPRRPSKTVIAGGSGGGGRSHLHPYIPRTLSVRECARIQTFPDDYVFLGPVARQFTQVGNAVPPVLGAQLGKAIRESFF